MTTDQLGFSESMEEATLISLGQAVDVMVNLARAILGKLREFFRRYILHNLGNALGNPPLFEKIEAGEDWGLDVKKLAGREGYRLRIGQYRAIYIHEMEVIVIDAGPRGDVYK